MKSHARSPLLEAAICIYKDACAKCAAGQPDPRDIKTLISRFEYEGLSFLTITLPNFGVDFDLSLSQGYIASNLFQGFRKRLAIPAFLQGMLRHVFDEATGRCLNECNTDINAVEGIRQIAYSFKKILVPCSRERESAAIREFIEAEHDFERTAITSEERERFSLVASRLWSSVFYRDFDPYSDTIPKHGPGATAESIHGNRKYSHQRWHERLEPYFPFVENAYANAWSIFSKEAQEVTLVPEEEEQPVKVTLVPKTLKSPRIIAIEPVCMQYTQQGLSKYIVDILEKSRLTRGHVNFRDQRVNQRIALSSSADRRYATLDLSAASDRVPLDLAISMFDCNPDLRDSIFSCRSKKAQLPTGEVIPLLKFASMGSALCFPVESMYFYTLCIAARLEKHNLPVTFRNIYLMSRDVYIYGDDIIVPTDDAAFVADHLQKYYCKVGATKSHWKGSFRESCGVDAYLGTMVTPTYIRRIPPSNKRSSDSLISWVATANQFYLKGYWLTADHMFNACERIIGKLPYVGPECAGLGKLSFLQRRSIGRWNKRLMRFEVKAYVAAATYRSDRIEGQAALLKSLLHMTSIVNGECAKDHLERSARHGVATLKRRWIPVEF